MWRAPQHHASRTGIDTTVASRLERAERICLAIAAAQHGAFNRTQALRAGLDDDALGHRVRCGQLERHLPEVFVVAGSAPTQTRDIMVATLWPGSPAAASFLTAAALWSFDGVAPDRVDISTTAARDARGLRLPSGRSIIVHRVDATLVAEIMDVDGIPVTAPRRTLLDLCGVRYRRSEALLDEALRRGLTTVGELWLYVEQEWMRGRRGVRILRDLLIPRSMDQAPTESDLEIMALRLLHRGSLATPETQWPVRLPVLGEVRIDLAYPTIRLAIELDSLAWHMNRRAFERDRQKDIELGSLGWTVLRFTWAMLRYKPDWVAQVVRTNYDRLLHSSTVGTAAR